MPENTLSLGSELLGARVQDDDTAARALALYNYARRVATGNPLLHYTGLGVIGVSAAWIAWQFFGSAERQERLQGKRTGMLGVVLRVLCTLAWPFIAIFGRFAEGWITKSKASLPHDHAHAIAITGPILNHLPLVGIPVTVRIGEHDEVVEFTESDGEVHVRWADHEACLWITTCDDANQIAVTNVSEVARNAVRRSGCIEVCSGNLTSHVSDASLANLLEELDLGGNDILSRDIEMTTLSTNAAHTVRFELVS